MRKKNHSLLLRIIILIVVLTAMCVAVLFFMKVKKHIDGNPEGTEVVIQDKDTLAAQIRQCLVAHSARIRVSFSSNESYRERVSELVDELMKKSYEPTGNPKEGDYIKYQLGGYTVSYGGNDTLTSYKNDIYIEPIYYTDIVQEKEIDDAVNTILTELDFNDSTSDYDKVRAVYEYLCKNVKYDTVHKKNKYYHLNATAYAALINNDASCQGFCVALERLLLESGVECRIITGNAVKDGITEFHSWNIVCIDGLYYNIDTTWGRVLETDEYFLKSDENFLNHERDAEFLTDKFYNEYPMSDTDY